MLIQTGKFRRVFPTRSKLPHKHELLAERELPLKGNKPKRVTLGVRVARNGVRMERGGLGWRHDSKPGSENNP